ncbi:hypothetical protein CQP30_08575 [Yersinia pestis]|uniref:Membrane protein n=6 Tax=Yersinia pseudotuberculosis complex TaxID=1649845 RepID=A0A384LBP6_YERPE|nr:hypothetical protein BAY22_08050 [Yersinia pestis]AYW88315.1 hypothetical protein EGX87_14670 [Yersinia pseudotuberculosis]EDM42703.1 putative membrane protein [Yersinia pestis CA88-4125]KJG86775.1 membrane protein [Yersinia pestis subsp. microtus bv. Ulegeica]KKM49326.1 membrane protein [Yersinia pestis subsp. pestis bv. Orientalis]KPD48469.1 hypothetical protein AC472_01605 [Yersinia pestis subsp. microtus bv. Caucasica]KPD58173.1 hypothetical protein AC596_02700 [Yersinia pestis subsp. 
MATFNNSNYLGYISVPLNVAIVLTAFTHVVLNAIIALMFFIIEIACFIVEVACYGKFFIKIVCQPAIQSVKILSSQTMK